MRAVTVVPAPAGLARSSRPPTARTRSARPSQPGAVRGVRAADPVVRNLDHGHVVCPHELDHGAARVRILRDVGQRLGGDEVRGGLDPLREPFIELHLERNRHVRAGGERLECGEEPVVEDGGMETVRELTQLGERLRQLFPGRCQQLLGRGGIGVDAGLREPERDRKRHEPLLRAVVQVALDPPSGGIARLQDPRARELELGLRQLAVGDVAGEGVAARLVAGRDGRPVKPAVRAVPVEMPLLVHARLNPRAEGAQIGERGVPVLRVDEAHERLREQLLLGEAERALERGVDLFVIAVVAEHAEHVDRQVEEAVELGSRRRHVASA